MLGAFVIYYVFFQWGAPYFVAFVGHDPPGVWVSRRADFGPSGEDRAHPGGPDRHHTFLQAAGYPVFGPLVKHVPPVFAGTGTSSA